MPSQLPRVCVLGGGANGLWSAIRLLENGYKDVIVVSKSWTPFTTSNVAVAVWEPFMVGPKQDPQLLDEWGEATWRHLLALRRAVGERESGVQYISGFWLSRTIDPAPSWAKVVLNFRKLSRAEQAEAGFDPATYKQASFLTTLLIDMTQYMKLTMERLKLLGGKLETRVVKSLHDLRESYDLVVNCSGLGAHDLAGVADKSLYPIRGQLALVKHPHVRHFILDEEVYMFPRKNALLCGGTYQQGNWSTAPSPSDEATILERCAKLVPEVETAEVLGPRVGLRPGRPSVRVEIEAASVNPVDGARRCPVVHNYGHGGAGITLHYGCANDVVRLACVAIGAANFVQARL